MAKTGTWGASVLALVIWGVGAAVAAYGQTPAPAAAEPAAPPKPTVAEPTAAAAAPGKPAEKSAWNGFWLQSADGSFKARVGGLAQGDGRFYTGDGGAAVTDSFLVRRAYFTVQGEVGRYVSFFLNSDFGDGKASLEDGYVDVRLRGKVRVRVGKTKSPVGLEHLQGTGTLHFIERGLPTQLSPNRDIGVMLHGEVAGGVIAFAAGAFDGTGDGASLDRDTNDSKELVGRVFIRPFRKRKSAMDLGLGVAGSHGDHEGALTDFRYRTAGQQAFFTYNGNAMAKGTRSRLAPQAYAYHRFVGIMGEWTRSSQEAAKDKSSAAVKLTHEAWGVTGSLVLTGEKASYAGVKPRRGFDPEAGAWGALELVARAGQVRVDEAAFSNGLADWSKVARRARSWALGLNWHLSENFKYAVNFERTSFVGGAVSGDRLPESVVLFRAQAAF